MDLKETGREGANLIHMAQDRDQWRAFVNRAMNLRVASFEAFAAVIL
jgi:hypothetical protein